MSNRFKFRAWHKEDQKMLVVVGVSYGINLETDCADIISIDCAEVTDGRWKFAGNHDADEVILMQSTGLKDKNGVEIFEGDIVRLVDLGFGDLGCYEVEFNDDSAGFLMCFNQEIRHFIDHHPEEEIEVIGNIHENPELLESGNE